MSILIKGMNLPKNVTSIEVHKIEGGYYAVDGTNLCPIVEIPTPHGNIIDTDELYWKYDCIDDLDMMLEPIKIILEAEE